MDELEFLSSPVPPLTAEEVGDILRFMESILRVTAATEAVVVKLAKVKV